MQLKSIPLSFLLAAFLGLVLVSPNNIAAQEFNLHQGFYLTKDSLRKSGFFALDGLDNNIVRYYVTETDPNPVKLTPGDAVYIEGTSGWEVFTQNVVFEQKPEKIFIVSVLSGDIRLYRGYSEKQGKLFFLSTRDRPAIMPINKHAPGPFLKTYFSGCEITHPVEYTENSLLRVLEKYGACRGLKSAPVVISYKKKISVSFGLKGSYYSGEPNVKDFYGGNYAAVSGWSPGAIMQVNVVERFSLRAGIAWYSKKLSSDTLERSIIHQDPWSFNYRDPVEFSVSSLEIPLEVVWVILPRKSLTPYFSIGGGVAFPLQSKLEKHFTAPIYFEPSVFSFTLDEVIAAIPDKMTPVKQAFFSGAAQIGILKKFKNQSVLDLGLRYASSNEKYETRIGQATVQMNRLEMVLNYFFPKKSMSIGFK